MSMEMIKPRDFIETKEGLIFAAINEDAAFLRYLPCDDGDRVRDGKRYVKVSSTRSSFEYLEKNYPMYLTNKRFQHCPPERIQRIYKPVEKLRELRYSKNKLARRCLKLSGCFEDI